MSKVEANREKTASHKVTMYNNSWASCFYGSEAECNKWIKDHPFDSYQFMILPNKPTIFSELRAKVAAMNAENA